MPATSVRADPTPTTNAVPTLLADQLLVCRGGQQPGGFGRISLLYGISGSTDLRVIGQKLAERPANDPLTLIALVTLTAGLLFKVAGVPFHQWLPDAYEGAPSPITAFISVAPKAAAFALTLRFLFIALKPLQVNWIPMLSVICVLTMTCPHRWPASRKKSGQRDARGLFFRWL